MLLVSVEFVIKKSSSRSFSSLSLTHEAPAMCGDGRDFQQIFTLFTSSPRLNTSFRVLLSGFPVSRPFTKKNEEETLPFTHTGLRLNLRLIRSVSFVTQKDDEKLIRGKISEESRAEFISRCSSNSRHGTDTLKGFQRVMQEKCFKLSTLHFQIALLAEKIFSIKRKVWPSQSFLLLSTNFRPKQHSKQSRTEKNRLKNFSPRGKRFSPDCLAQELKNDCKGTKHSEGRSFCETNTIEHWKSTLSTVFLPQIPTRDDVR